VLNITPIYEITPFTLLDYQEYPSAIIWFAGCNMRCQYCYNPDIVFSKGNKSIEDALNFLKRRQGLLEGVVLSGGEATNYTELEEFCISIKSLGYKIKLDTNGTDTLMIKNLVEKGLIDYIALDYKAPCYKFYEITKNRHFNTFEDTLKYILTCKADFEVRTTLHNDLLNEDDINHIIKELVKKGYKSTYYIQKFQNDVETIGALNNPVNNFDKSKLLDILNIEFRIN
jgi:pyruvate formate lyase activating enzyme